MNKKIKTLVQKYEKDMQFENRFDELKDKLDLIPDQNLNTDIIVIRKKLVPAYTMMIVLLMLVTGIIGLQFGLNSNYISGPDRVDIVDNQLSTFMDLYEREAVQTISVNEQYSLIFYVGYESNVKKVLIRLASKTPNVVLIGEIDGNTITASTNPNYYIVSINNTTVSINLDIVRNQNVLGSVDTVIDLSTYYDWLLG